MMSPPVIPEQKKMWKEMQEASQYVKETERIKIKVKILKNLLIE